MHDHAEQLSLSIWDSPFWRLINYNHISHHLLPSLLNRRDLLSSPDCATRIIVTAFEILVFFGVLYDHWTWNCVWLRHLSTLSSLCMALDIDCHIGLSIKHVASMLLFLLHSLSVQTEGPSIQPLALRSSSAHSSSLHPSICPLNSAPVFRAQRMEQMRTGYRTEQPLDRSFLVK